MSADPKSNAVQPELAGMKSYAAFQRALDTIRNAADQAIGTGFNSALDQRDAAERFMGLIAILQNTTRMLLWEDVVNPIVAPFDMLPALTKIGGNSPDADYFSFSVSPQYQYRLRGHRGSAIFYSAQMHSHGFDPETKQPKILLTSHIAQDQLQVDADNNYEILISAEKPAGYTGNWLKMDERSYSGCIRHYHVDQTRGADPEDHFTITVLNPPAQLPILDDDEVARRLTFFDFYNKFWFNARHWRPELLETEALNRFSFTEKGDEGRAQGLGLAADFQYEKCAWKLAPDEALLLEGIAPPNPETGGYYWCFQIADRWYEVSDFRRRTVHLNCAHVQCEADGSYRVVVSGIKPKQVKNWLDTGGRREGFLSMRWSPTVPLKVPKITVVKAASV